MTKQTSLKCENWVIHELASCQDCDWEEGNLLKARKAAYDHAKRTGHRVTCEVGRVFKYGDF